LQRWMAMTGLDAFDATVHKTNRWLHDVMEILGWREKHRAYMALRATLHALRDRLTVDEAAQLGAQLPMLVRGFYYEGWDPSGKPLRERTLHQFLARISREIGGCDPAEVARAVFRVLADHISEGEIDDIKHVLPSEHRELWP